MAEQENDIKIISKNQSGFPEHLDFATLRAEGIEHLGNLAGKIWTDHNVHDPGITILEALCYALLDLGYRTQLPAKDIFARNPDDKSEEDNFLTPARLLTVNPLTITDFRKLLIDIPGIKNAWLEIARDQNASEFCGREHPVQPPLFNNAGAAATVPPKDECCVEYLNGL